MSLPVIVRPAAETDIREIYAYLQSIRIGLGDQFSARLREVLDRVETNPASCGVVWEDVRAVRIRKFQYVVYYVVFADRVEVLAVLHGSRHESAWRSRSS
jgi:plasmid stabilization system protein ParE